MCIRDSRRSGQCPSLVRMNTQCWRSFQEHRKWQRGNGMLEIISENIISILCTIVMTGAIGVITKLFGQFRALSQAVMATNHDRLYQACTFYILTGQITIDELKNLEYLYDCLLYTSKSSKVKKQKKSWAGFHRCTATPMSSCGFCRKSAPALDEWKTGQRNLPTR